MIVLNTIVAKQLMDFKVEMDARLNAGEEKKIALVEILKKYYTESKRILFEGNGYSDEWVLEAGRRGLTNVNSAFDALADYISPKAVEVFEETEVLSSRELHARYEIELENYIKKIQIESRVVSDLALNHIVSTSVKYQFKLAQTARSLVELDMKKEAEPIKEIVSEISEHVSVIKKLVYDMTEKRKEANNLEDTVLKAKMYGTEIKAFFDQIRYHVDKLELVIDDEDWPLVKYREMLFIR